MGIDTLTTLKLTATGMSGMFFGACFYGTFTEHPARMSIEDTKSLRQQWKVTFHRAKKMQSGINIVGTAAAVGVFYLEPSDLRYMWLEGAVVFSLILPWTLIFMLPDINKLLEEDVIKTRGESWVRENIDKWNTRCHVRTLIGLTAFGLCMYGLLKN